MAKGTLTAKQSGRQSYFIIEWETKTNKLTCSTDLTYSVYLHCGYTATYSPAGSYEDTWDFSTFVSYYNTSNFSKFFSKHEYLEPFFAEKGEKKLIGTYAILGIGHNKVTGVYDRVLEIALEPQTLKVGEFEQLSFLNAWKGVVPTETIQTVSEISCPNSYFADYTTITITTYNSSFLHTISYDFMGSTGVIANNSSASEISWLVPASFINLLPNNTIYGTCKLTCESYYGGNYVGKQEINITLSMDPNINGPAIGPTIVDTNNVTVALTGNSSTIVKNYSIAQCNTNAVVQTANDSITNSYIRNGDKKITGTSGYIYFPTSSEFEFFVETKRGFTTRKVIKPTFIDYVAPTCHQKITTTLTGEENTQATIVLLITGNFFNGSFGAVNNTLKIEVQHTQNDGSMGDWVDVTPLLPTIEGNSFSLEVTVTGLDHNKSYNFTTRVTDQLTSTTSDDYTASVLPVFDWSNEDFNFNVPINMNGETVLRHNETANNTVLSATGGYIYFRQGGTNSTSTEVKITPQGNIELEGDIIINGQSLKSLLGIT